MTAEMAPQRLDLRVSPEILLSMLANAHVQFMADQQTILQLRQALAKLQPPPPEPKD